MPSRSRSMEHVFAAARWTEADARIALDKLRASGLSAHEFGRRYGVHPVRLLRWAARLSAIQALATSPRLAPVHVTPVATALVEVVLGARVLRVPATLDADLVAQLVRAVDAA